jgi:hypothetical protein
MSKFGPPFTSLLTTPLFFALFLMIASEKIPALQLRKGEHLLVPRFANLPV